MNLSAQQIPPATTKNEQDILDRSWVLSFLTWAICVIPVSNEMCVFQMFSQVRLFNPRFFLVSHLSFMKKSFWQIIFRTNFPLSEKRLTQVRKTQQFALRLVN